MNRRHLFHCAFFILSGWLPAAAQGVLTAISAHLVTAAPQQIGRTLIHDAAFVSRQYPMGDVPEDRGVCADVMSWGDC